MKEGASAWIDHDVLKDNLNVVRKYGTAELINDKRTLPDNPTQSEKELFADRAKLLRSLLALIYGPFEMRPILGASLEGHELMKRIDLVKDGNALTVLFDSVPVGSVDVKTGTRERVNKSEDSEFSRLLCSVFRKANISLRLLEQEPSILLFELANLEKRKKCLKDAAKPFGPQKMTYLMELGNGSPRDFMCKNILSFLECKISRCERIVKDVVEFKEKRRTCGRFTIPN